MNIAERMRELLPKLKAGVNGIGCPEVRPECEGDWNEHYALLQTFYWDMPLDNDYFDEDRFRADTEKLIKDHFTEEGRETKLFTEQPPAEFIATVKPGTIMIRLFYRSQEIEVYVIDPKPQEEIPDE